MCCIAQMGKKELLSPLLMFTQVIPSSWTSLLLFHPVKNLPAHSFYSSLTSSAWLSNSSFSTWGLTTACTYFYWSTSHCILLFSFSMFLFLQYTIWSLRRIIFYFSLLTQDLIHRKCLTNGVNKQMNEFPGDTNRLV
jgi:hypothetical protein